ncbi:MAG: hypothetical protein APF84_04200 [Gracilibacter sp. BRH_c7a]|nr:MAG: hypothetical protein APF84_04200 [Gracilibacter sp. BRH_c7a]
MTDNAVQIENLTYFYPNREAPSLSGINLKIKQGRFIVIMGMNGSGKTTLALSLNGIIPQLLEGRMLGKVYIEGKDTGKFRPQSLANSVGLVFQDPESQIIGSTVAEDTAFGPRNLGLPPEEIEHRVQTELAKVQLAGYEARKTDELSGGEKQRLALAGVSAMYPKVLVLDEPASELDPEGRAALYTALDELRREGSHTIIVIEHSIEDVWNRADEVIVLKDGKVAWQGEPEKLFRNLSLLDQLGIRPLPVNGISSIGESDPWRQPCNICIQGMEKDVCQEYTGQEGDPRGRIHIRDLTHHYHSSNLSLDQINLTIHPGEFVALIGPNGAGKTTLTKHLNGLLEPIKGDVWVSGKNTRQYKTAELAGTVGYVFQNPDHQLFETTVEKELAFGLKNAGKSVPEIQNRVDEVLGKFGLEEYRLLHPLTLGKSLRQMLAVASAIVLQPDILVVDEPTKGLDWPGAKRVMAIIRTLHKEGTTIIMITHDMELATHAQRVVVLNEGRIISGGNADEKNAE